MIHTIRNYTTINATTEETYNFNCNVLNGLMIHNSTKNNEIKVSVRVGRYQLISDVTLAGLNTILAPKVTNRDHSQWTIPFGALNVQNQTITLTIENTGASSKTLGLAYIYDNGKGMTTKPICYKSYTTGEFSASNVVSCAFSSQGTGSLVASTDKFTWTHGGNSESADAQAYENVWVSLSNNEGTAGKQALILNGSPSTLNMTGPYSATDEYVIAYV